MRLKSGICGAGLVFAVGVLMTGSEAAQAPAGEASEAGGMRLVWAYPGRGNAGAPAPGDASIEHVPGSVVGYTKAQIADLFVAPDWFPAAHPPMPEVVAEGRKPELYACGHCHLPNGLGRPENESLAGLPVAYIEAQVADFKNGLRHSSDPGMPVPNMILVAKAARADEIRAAAEYYASLKPKKWTRVVETDTVPTTHAAGWMLVVGSPAVMEPIGERVIEVSEDIEQTELRNYTSGFVAYVPTGSLKAGESLVRTGDHGRFLACVVCHGQNLHGQHFRGMGDVPPIAGRSPSQMARQLFDFRSGARQGKNSALMRMMASRLSDSDLVAITAYLASLDPESDH